MQLLFQTMSRDRANVFYRRNASGYDASAARTMVLRRRTIDYLALQPGDAVLDAGCGTGLSFPLLLDRTGPAGSVIGVEASPEMLALARVRCSEAGWQNVTLIEADLERVELPCPADAVLFNYTHDVMRSAAALANIFRQTRAGARIAAAGIKHPPRWLDPLRLYRRFKSRQCYDRPEGLDTPWDLLAREVADLRVESTLFGTGYIAWGRLSGRRAE